MLRSKALLTLLALSLLGAAAASAETALAVVPAEAAPSGGAGQGAAKARPEEMARTAVETLHAALIRAMQEADTLGFEGRYRALAPVVGDAYDFDFMASKTLGRHWNELTETERERWRDAFQRLTVSTYSDRFDGYGGERFETLGSEPSVAGTVLVHTRLVLTEDDPVALDYRLRPLDGGFRIVDVYLEGTVSELALRRSDYSSLLKREGFESLMRAIEGKIAEAEADPVADSR